MRKFRKTSKNNDSIAYCKARREYKKLLNKKKEQLNDAILNELIESVNDQKTFWNTMHKVQSRKTQPSIILDLYLRKTQTQKKMIYSKMIMRVFFNRPISKEEVLIAINKSKPRKAAGSDGVIGEMMMYAGDCVVDFLVKLFNTLFDEGLFPDNWT